jgi:GNAT superfamily N-acetyltransferase
MTIGQHLRIDLATASDAPMLAALHGTILPGSRLSLFGQDYLTACYRYLVASRDEVVFVARADGYAVGGAFVSLAPGSLSRRLARHTPLLVQLALRPLGLGARQIMSDLIQPPSPPLHQPELVAIFVAQNYQGRGIGEMICRVVEADLSRRRHSSYVVHTERNPANRAIAFYLRLGFLPMESGARRHSMVMLRKTLP